MKVKRGDSASFTTTALARQDEAVSELDAKLSNQVNGTFSPSRASGQQARFGYTVANQTPSGAKLMVTVRATSRAGVAEDTWQQPIEASQINHIGGSFNGSQTTSTPYGDSVLTFSGTVQFDRSSSSPSGSGAGGGYSLSSGSYTLTASGYDPSSTGCQQSGSQQFTIPPGNGSFEVFNHTAPYTYKFQIMQSGSLTVTRSNCPPGFESFDGTTYQAVLARTIGTNDYQTSQDGTAYDGTETEAQGGNQFTENWSFQGTP
jgi:hypothetical protein